MDKTNSAVCGKCGKEYKIEIIKYSGKTEKTRVWKNYCYCPYCGHIIEMLLNGDEDAVIEAID